MTQIREEVCFTKGRIIVRGKLVTRGKAKRADYILYYKPNIPIAIIEAKDNNHAVGDGMQQALDYAETLDIPFVFSSNGDGFVFHDRTGQSAPLETNLALDAFPSPGRALGAIPRLEGSDARSRSRSSSRTTTTTAAARTRATTSATPSTRTIEAIAKGQNRILLVMATGTGKTYTAFQIIWRLWKAGQQEAHPLPGRPQRPDRPDHGQRLPALRRGHGQAQHRAKTIERRRQPRSS